jgi:pyridoxamine 5'-phosphate oxidase
MNAPAAPWALHLDSLHAAAWQHLARGVQDRHAPTRHPTLATVTPDGRPALRTVVLRSADKASGMLEIHTDLNSEKVAQLQANPAAALHIWDARTHLQIRLQASATLHHGPDVAQIWARVPEAARASYGIRPAPGQPIPEGLAYHKHPDPAAFAVLRLWLTEMDILHLGPEHRRARFTQATDWAGEWLAP